MGTFDFKFFVIFGTNREQLFQIAKIGKAFPEEACLPYRGARGDCWVFVAQRVIH